ncbi:MAG: hypothetical protein A2787_02535 [Omnitrophica WOR_2 bacterium RIFCSPHIGHO2_01_FULL_48_9]|nr:MAG: hypothetical protein A3D10_01725 [Omnitrophica WOR_2 bacterium RIFCSPHIGHO2_02_FULL_48_11]OGX32502.1 MAG: hypothetical protein A2787_02535 [Omnitrophica WOR_2 bacterium RIFCSPHIGHO2_01_FULL_48_9]
MWNKITGFFNKSSSPGPGKTILVIDDGQVDRRTAEGILKKRGYTVLCAEDGEAGLRIAREKPLDLILLDYVMPGLNGIEVGKQLRSDEKTKSIPIIFLTGSDTPGNIIRYYDLGAEQFLVKPVSAKTLLAQVAIIFQEENLR